MGENHPTESWPVDEGSASARSMPIAIPDALKGRPPTNARYEGEVDAWGPFHVYLEDSPIRPAYLGSRLRFRYDGQLGRFLVEFFPTLTESSKVYAVVAGEAPVVVGDELRFRVEGHGLCVLAPVPAEKLQHARELSGLT
jgi:hypothetical protein